MNDSTNDPLFRRHMLLGWWALLIFLSMGAALELLHALKMGFYLDVSSGTRRLLWTLSHAHGGLISIELTGRHLRDA